MPAMLNLHTLYSKYDYYKHLDFNIFNILFLFRVFIFIAPCQISANLILYIMYHQAIYSQM